MASATQPAVSSESPSTMSASVDQIDSTKLSFYALPYRELRRRLWHMSPGLLPFILQQFPHKDPISQTLRLIIVGLCVVVAGRILYRFRHIQRQGEATGRAAVGGYVLSVLVTALLFPRDLELALSVLSILAFGDGAATLFGMLLRGPRLPWNAGKSWSGFLAFISVGSVMTAWIYWAETHNAEAADPAVSFGLAFVLTMPAVILAAAAESVRSRLNDNIRVGIIAAISLALMHSFRTG